MSGAPNLKRFVANGNHGLNGMLPEELFTMTRLEHLYLADCNLSGDLPPALFTLASIETLNLAQNEFHGTISATIGSATKLRELVLSLNYLEGSIPSEINQISTLEKLDIRHQLGPKPIEGRLPDFANATRLHFIDLSNNALSFTLPETLLASSSVADSDILVDLNNNDISGGIPSTYKRFAKLDLRLANNRIDQIPHELCAQGGWYVHYCISVVTNAILFA